ncbi:hypothetical protein At1D1108_26770 [Agrobacterium tumefaciens]|uniref:winged helix-turn-helix domain-containing protein n=1 Tax=Agrobacterium tumefaciens TaxID=358 RepID=UPI000EF2E1B2|nr:hypothetical protein At1D1108_26770 [Agrobacterium tumefaciens]
MPDCAEQIADDLALTETERKELLPSGRQRILQNRIYWAKFYMTRAGLIESPARGRFVASDLGRKLLETNAAAINVDTLKSYPSFVEFYSSSKTASGRGGRGGNCCGRDHPATTSATPE